MSQVPSNDFEQAILCMAGSLQERLYAMSEEDLSSSWHFTWEDNLSIEQNAYYFFEALRLHQSRCRRWEEKHNSSCCVVERVRDKYLKPRIGAFMEKLREEMAKGSREDEASPVENSREYKGLPPSFYAAEELRKKVSVLEEDKKLLIYATLRLTQIHELATTLAPKQAVGESLAGLIKDLQARHIR